MGYRAKRGGLIAGGVIGGGMVFVFLQMLLPFPYGLQWGLVLFSIIVGICIVVAFLAYKSDEQKQTGKSPLSILKERLAKGEITKEEYDRLKKEFE